MGKMANEVKTGMMVVVCAFILIFITLRIGGFGALKKGYDLKVQFNYASGIKKGAPAYLTGVEKGEVKDVKVDYTDEGTKVTLVVWLDESAKIRQDSKASIATMGLMGEKYLELTSGSKGSPFLPAGSLMVGKEPMQMEEIMDKAVAIADNLNSGIGDLRKLAKDVNSIMVDNRSQIDGIIKNLNETSQNFKEFSDDIRRNPWKILARTKEKPKEEKADVREGKGAKGNKGLF